jgi:hypothetical protein
MKEEAQMAIIKSYPHVNVSVDALLRPRAPFVESGATTLFVPFISSKGSDKIEKIYNLAQFIDEYGSPNFDTQGRGILNAYNWLTRGGVVYALRLVGNSVASSIGFRYVDGERVTNSTEYFRKGLVTANPIWIESGSKGTEYDNYTVSIIATNQVATTYIDGTSTVDIIIRNSIGQTVQTIQRLNKDNLKSRIESTRYINFFALNVGVTFENLWVAAKANSLTGTTRGTAQNSEGQLTLTGGTNTGAETLSDLNTLIEGFFGDTVTSQHNSVLLGNRLEHSIDLILDAGYSIDAKSAIATFLGSRDDITGIFDTFDFTINQDGEVAGDTDYLTEAPFLDKNNIAVYSQRLTVNDPISGKEIWVTPTYFLSRLIPVNDRTYGLQWPTAGLTRGVLEGVTGIDFNPTNTTDIDDINGKEYLYVNKINYIERDARGYRFMSQSTRSALNTALKFVNNVRVVNRMARELENLGRNYLFEFNDSITLKNMSNVLNRYVGEWIQNRTLSYGLVTVDKNEFSDEKVDVTLNIRFTGTIEIISIAITIE